MFQKKQIRIGIDARFYGPKQKGLGRYVQKLVENLERIVGDDVIVRSERSERRSNPVARLKSMKLLRRFASRNDKLSVASRNDQYEFVIFLRKENWSEYQPTSPNFKKVLADCQWYSLAEQILMPFQIRQAKVDLMHFPHFNVPVLYRKPFVITIHDLILKRFPTRRASTLGLIRYWLKNLAYQLVISSAIKRAKKIITVSSFTKNDILRYFRVEPKKVKVIYEGAPILSGVSFQSSTLRMRSLQGHYSQGQTLKIKKPYLLYVGNAYPHKNLERLILAFQKLSEEKKDLQLVLVGELDYFYQRLQKQFSNIEGVVFADFVSDQELAGLYQNASLYVFPSLYEGFGLPPLEAMAYNLPVICSRASCLPEILGEAAIYFDPEDADDMVGKIKRALEDKDLQEKLILEGGKRIQRYSWEKMAQKVFEVYLRGV
jgi:glycosyltransferase involved in cell wall biosynthesis